MEKNRQDEEDWSEPRVYPLNLKLIRATDEPYKEPWRPGLVKFAKWTTYIIVVVMLAILVIANPY